MLRKLNKKGSHIGLVVSFLIFIIFITFLRIITEPSLFSNQEKKVILDDVEKELIASASFKVTTTTTKIMSTSQDCVDLENFISYMNFSRKIIVKNKKGDAIPTYTSPGNPNTLRILRDNQEDNFFKIYNSEGLNDISSMAQSCDNIVEGEYTIGTTIQKEYLYESLILQLIDDYSKSPKFERSDSPSSVNLGISFIYNNGTEIGTRNRNISTDVFVREDSIEYLDSKGDIHPGKLVLKIW